VVLYFLRLTPVKNNSDHPMRFLFSIVIFLCSSFSAAEDFIDLEISINQMSSYYRAYIFFEGDERYKKPILAIAKNASNYDDLLSNKPKLLQRWRIFIEQVNRGFEGVGASRNINLQANWTLKNVELRNALNNELKEHAENKQSADPKSKYYVRLLLLRMEKILTAYMSLTNALGGLGVSAESIDIEAEILEVSNMLTLMNPQEDALKRVAKKWAFVSRVLLKYETRIAPYVVIHGYEKIREELGEYLATSP
jgi:uncharacterized protein YukE